MGKAEAEIIGLLVGGIFLAVMIYLLFLRPPGGQRQLQGALLDVPQLHGLLPVPDPSSMTERFSPLLEHWCPYRTEWAFTCRVGGRDAFLLGLYGERSRGAGSIQHDYSHRHAYLVVCPVGPSVRVTRKGVFGKPAQVVKISEDPRFSREFWVDGSDEGGVRSFLSPELRRFLLARGGAERFQAGPEGAALIEYGGPLPPADASQIRATLERLAAFAEAGPKVPYSPVSEQGPDDKGGPLLVAPKQGLRLIPDLELPWVTRRVQGLIQPLAHMDVTLWKPGPVFSFTVGRREAFLYELRFATNEGGGGNHQRAYVVLAPPAPYLRTIPRGLRGLLERLDRGKPADPIEFSEDPAFSRAFWVEGSEKWAIRGYLHSEFRRFLVTYAKGWRFHAGPEGVALVHRGRAPKGEASKMTVKLEQLARLAEAAARG